MTWDVYAVRTGGGIRRLEDLPQGYSLPVVGTADEVVAAVREVAPYADTTDPSWLVVAGADHTVEISLGKASQVHDVTFYVSEGEGAVGVILDVCRRLRVTPYDTETGEILTLGSRPPGPPPPDDEDGGRRWWWPWGR